MTVNRHYIIAINGGIGSGKSVVSRIVTVMGYPVYDCDAQARQLMDSSDEIKAAISAGIHHACIKDGQIDRAMLASIVFEDKEKLAILNSIVHGAVREHYGPKIRPAPYVLSRQQSFIRAAWTQWSMKYGPSTPLLTCALSA